ncbi:hypothetical protein PF010_g1929 [Phytophthora fragariae]|uniref:Uncharacterized protein n=1 Tax=Phytophthora fragariae TaxID=53985 RepID=A0A6A4ET11_9STRA|nr:hypothetical protein PF009_g2574 [Phytophthora fragariae]KAE9028192.1 hypothetical protein PF011_g1681 [Phytophthora fragariae]KAE9135795.1 hypothetical protein PF010_g1929 [Phytophthora fragariae]KAE9154196.1 hypothetical protein PF006_g1771 [Phytophthora fragariae]KAE9254570.1 hypothetical protein PF002_g2801 [Phytophthora fragariae]
MPTLRNGLCSGDFSVLPSKITCEPFACAVQCGAVLSHRLLTQLVSVFNATSLASGCGHVVGPVTGRVAGGKGLRHRDRAARDPFQSSGAAKQTTA